MRALPSGWGMGQAGLDGVHGFNPAGNLSAPSTCGFAAPADGARLAVPYSPAREIARRFDDRFGPDRGPLKVRQRRRKPHHARAQVQDRPRIIDRLPWHGLGAVVEDPQFAQTRHQPDEVERRMDPALAYFGLGDGMTTSRDPIGHASDVLFSR